jgi:hypothetical protein
VNLPKPTLIVPGTSTPIYVPGGGPEIGPIKVLHRHDDGYISFMVRDGDDIGKRFAIRASELTEIFPEFTAHLIRDSFVSINAGYTLANHSGAAFGCPKHRTEFLRYLCACYVDLDYYNLGLERPSVIYELERMWANGDLPRVSMIVDSGRGMWLLWLLHDPSRPHLAHLGAFADNPLDHLQLYTKANKALRAKLAHVGADPIYDAVRHIRVPGSFRSDCEEFVQWDIKGNAHTVNSYALKDLAKIVGVQTTPRPPAERRALASTLRAPGTQSRAWDKTNQNRLAAISALRDLRGGGFKKGIRNKAAFLYALSLKAVRSPFEEIKAAVLDMGRQCDPQLSPGECIRAAKQARKATRVRLSYRTVADELDVSPPEAEVLTQMLYGNTRPGDRRFFPAATRFGNLQPVTTTLGGDLRSTKSAIRQTAILRVVSSSPEIPSIREMMRQLEGIGVETSIGTLQKEYKRLGLISGAAMLKQNTCRIEQLCLVGAA